MIVGATTKDLLHHTNPVNEIIHYFLNKGHAVTQFVEGTALQVGRSRARFPMVSLTQSFQPHYGPGVDSASNRNEYQEYFLGGKGGRCVGLTTLPPSGDDCLKIWESQPPGTHKSCPGM